MRRIHIALCHFRKWLLRAGAISRFSMICSLSFDFAVAAQGLGSLGLMGYPSGIGVSTDKQNCIEKCCRECRERIVHGFELGHYFVLLVFIFGWDVFIIKYGTLDFHISNAKCKFHGLNGLIRAKYAQNRIYSKIVLLYIVGFFKSS